MAVLGQAGEQGALGLDQRAGGRMDADLEADIAGAERRLGRRRARLIDDLVRLQAEAGAGRDAQRDLSRLDCGIGAGVDPGVVIGF